MVVSRRGEIDDVDGSVVMDEVDGSGIEMLVLIT